MWKKGNNYMPLLPSETELILNQLENIAKQLTIKNNLKIIELETLHPECVDKIKELKEWYLK